MAIAAGIAAAPPVRTTAAVAPTIIAPAANHINGYLRRPAANQFAHGRLCQVVNRLPVTLNKLPGLVVALAQMVAGFL
jgi:hypothetical protein